MCISDKTYHNANDSPVDDILGQSCLQLQLAKSSSASQELSNDRGDEASH